MKCLITCCAVVGVSTVWMTWLAPAAFAQYTAIEQEWEIVRNPPGTPPEGVEGVDWVADNGNLTLRASNYLQHDPGGTWLSAYSVWQKSSRVSARAYNVALGW